MFNSVLLNDKITGLMSLCALIMMHNIKRNMQTNILIGLSKSKWTDGRAINITPLAVTCATYKLIFNQMFYTQRRNYTKM